MPTDSVVCYAIVIHFPTHGDLQDVRMLGYLYRLTFIHEDLSDEPHSMGGKMFPRMRMCGVLAKKYALLFYGSLISPFPANGVS